MLAVRIVLQLVFSMVATEEATRVTFLESALSTPAIEQGAKNGGVLLVEVALVEAVVV